MPRRSSVVPPLSIVILAAGQGKRMKSELPKVLQPLAGRPLLAHVLDTAARLDATGIHVVHGHGGEQVRAALADAPVHWVLQAEQLGTGHAVQQAMPQVPDGQLVLVLYGDVPLLRAETLQALVARAGARTVALLTVTLADPTGYGRIVRDRRGQVLRIVEQKDASVREQRIREGNTGVLCAPAGLLRRWLGRLRNANAQGEYYLTDVIAMARRERCAVVPIAAPSITEVLGVNDKLQLAELEAAYRRRRAEELLRAGVTLIDPARIDVRGEVTVDSDVLLDVNVVLEGPVHLGRGVRVGPNSVLIGTRVAAGTEIRAHCVLERAVIGPDCQIGPFARVRPGSELAGGVHVGNFVEIKNSVLGAGSKANHLSYVGDATIGGGVNVGAGTITCNYDGVNKWRTEIGDRAFIGSGTMLVAPVRIGAGATIGAGSTITRDAPPGQLTLERSQQHTVADWQRPTRKK
ncbi:MAG: bifunctional UDP-N-acetylglucosamine diphosphorylase/glucosamine-1-phosphate N-acetyltransferase GlmU [Gammaproteobacteria bacterium]|nr:bifunctional UDP-N-acetylglucosamine diphosphorylase/glucosamine-1-phosphate N-acetyltransferase GlmU [Gammaproteobacteria bacterium]